MAGFRYINVLLSNLKLDSDNIFTYKVNTDIYDNVTVGMRAVVPFGFKNRPEEGYVIETDVTFDYDESKIKEIKSIPDRFVYFDEEKGLLIQKLITPVTAGEQTAEFLEFHNDLSLNHVKNNKAETPVQALIQTGAILTRRSESIISKLSKNDSTLLEGIISFFDM